jgi:glycosyltransferase involved in cell wall biosynthesis
MRTSIIIPTYNGAHKILNVLQAIEQQSYKDFEVIVVVDGSTDNTTDLLRKQKFDFQSFQILEQTNQGRSVVRNNGAKNSKGDLLIFFDDDMIPLENCVEKHIEHHQKHPCNILTGGTSENKSKSTTDIQLYKVYLSNKWSIPLIELSGKPLPKENIFITAQNFSISKKTFLELERFDENLKDEEDFDLAVRAFKKNIPLYYNQNAFAWHDDPITCLSYIKRQREYRAMHEKLLTLKPDLYNAFPMRTTQLPKGIKAFIFKLFTFRFWVWTVDSFNLMRILPQSLRYKIYDLIISANGVYYPERIDLQ